MLNDTQIQDLTGRLAAYRAEYAKLGSVARCSSQARAIAKMITAIMAVLATQEKEAPSKLWPEPERSVPSGYGSICW